LTRAREYQIDPVDVNYSPARLGPLLIRSAEAHGLKPAQVGADKRRR
jgi:hypothetical protein